MSFRLVIFLVLIGFSQFSCKNHLTSTSKTIKPDWLSKSLSKYPGRSLGLSIYDPESKKTVFQHNSENYFVPASNTKIYTLYAALKHLEDSLLAFKYYINKDTLHLLATGDPSFLHPDLPNSHSIDFLKKPDFQFITLNFSNFDNKALGKGWAWDDYNDYYQTEINAVPMYGNIIRVKSENYITTVNPDFFKTFFAFKPGTEGHLIRNVNSNVMTYSQNLSSSFHQDIPQKTSEILTVELLADTIKKQVTINKSPVFEYNQKLYSIPLDTVYRRMMQVSDNMLAEQLLLMVAGKLTDTLCIEKAITKTLELDLHDLPQKPRWVDGSGLSRYNLTTPTNTILVLEKLLNENQKERLFGFFAAGGKNGTLKKYFDPNQETFIYAKSGSMSGVYNISGYLKAKSGKWLIFSIMNNNFTESVSEMAMETANLIHNIRKSY